MPSRNIKDCVKELQDAWPKIVAAYEKECPGKTLNLTATHRTPEEQLLLFKKGRINNGSVAEPLWEKREYLEGEEAEEIVTNCDGWVKLSPHNYYPSRAFDVVVVTTTGKIPRELWNFEYYVPLIAICKKLGLVSGASWVTIKDGPHVEVAGYRTYKAKL